MNDRISGEELTLTNMTYGGDALGRLPDGRALFVQFGLPGERVKVDILEEKATYVRGRIKEILQPSPERIAPRCVHFGVCGGCAYQHLVYERQVEAKNSILAEQLHRLGGIKDLPLGMVVPSPDSWFYRNTVQFHVDQKGQLGYQEAGTHSVVPIRECFLPDPEVNAIWPLLDLDHDSGLERVTIRHGFQDEILIALATGTSSVPELNLELPISVVHQSGDESVTLAGEGVLEMELLGRKFKVTSGSFFQVNLRLAEELVKAVIARSEITNGAVVLDLYCGVGLFSSFLAEKSAQLVGIEASVSASQDFAANLDKFDNVELYQGSVEEVLPGLSIQPDLALVDPPRAGLGKTAIDDLVRLRPSKLLYVSCDPATLARDAKKLIENGYELLEVKLFDMFPQTWHIESLSVFTLK